MAKFFLDLTAITNELVAVPSYNTVSVGEQGLSTVYSRQILHLIKRAGMESLYKCACGCLSLVSLSDDSVGRIKCSAAFV